MASSPAFDSYPSPVVSFHDPETNSAPFRWPTSRPSYITTPLYLNTPFIKISYFYIEHQYPPPNCSVANPYHVSESCVTLAGLFGPEALAFPRRRYHLRLCRSFVGLWAFLPLRSARIGGLCQPRDTGSAGPAISSEYATDTPMCNRLMFVS